MSGPRYDTFAVEVDGGSRHVGRWGAGRPVVLAAHGITATHRSFRALAEQLGEEVSAYTFICRSRYGLTCRSARASCSVGSS
jgi:hypothetical protein